MLNLDSSADSQTISYCYSLFLFHGYTFCPLILQVALNVPFNLHSTQISLFTSILLLLYPLRYSPTAPSILTSNVALILIQSLYHASLRFRLCLKARQVRLFYLLQCPKITSPTHRSTPYQKLSQAGTHLSHPTQFCSPNYSYFLRGFPSFNSSTQLPQRPCSFLRLINRFNKPSNPRRRCPHKNSR